MIEERCRQFVKKIAEIVEITPVREIRSAVEAECRIMAEGIVKDVISNSFGFIDKLAEESHVAERRHAPYIISEKGSFTVPIKFNRIETEDIEKKAEGILMQIMKLGILVEQKAADKISRMGAVEQSKLMERIRAEKPLVISEDFFTIKRIEKINGIVRFPNSKFKNLTEALSYEFQMSNMIAHRKLEEKYGVKPKDVEIIASDMGFRRDYIGGELYWVVRYG